MRDEAGMIGRILMKTAPEGFVFYPDGSRRHSERFNLGAEIIRSPFLER